ncbi:MAG: type III-B CRISPR-associated protein Cas10/Cmr2, partial [Bacteroidetes bacterium]
TATEDGLVSLVENHIYALQKEGKVSLDQFVRFGVPNGNGFKYYRYRLPNTTEVALRELAYQEDGKLDSEYRKQIEEPFNQAVLDYESQRAKELSTKERRTLARKQADAEHAHFVAFKRARDDFRFRHKYLCFVKADGDNMGKVIQAIGNASGDLQQLSKILAEFAQAAVNEILAFGGIPIYAGGDDLFFVAPVQNERQAHILQLIKSLDEAFPQQALIRLAKQHQPGIKDLPSLSFGLSLTYHKYPMAEALENVDTLLLENAKQFELPGGKKNAVAFRVLKHSGQAFGTTLSKAELDKLLDLIAQSRQVDFNFLTSVQHKLADTKVLFEDALQHDVLPYYFEHHFNESVHQDNTFLQAVQAFCQLTYQMRTKDFDQVVYPALRFLQFLNQQDHD